MKKGDVFIKIKYAIILWKLNMCKAQAQVIKLLKICGSSSYQWLASTRKFKSVNVRASSRDDSCLYTFR